MSTTDALIEICSTDAIASGEAQRIDVEGKELAVFNVEGTFFAMDDLCSHGPGSLSEGFLDGYEIECDFHGGAFDIRTGEVTAPPCIEPMKTYRVQVHNNTVFIEREHP